MKKLGLFYIIILSIILTIFSFNAKAQHSNVVSEYQYKQEFNKTLEEVRAYFKEVTGRDTTTQISNINNFPATSQIIAYCMPNTRDTPSFLAFNHTLLKTMPEDMFQIILHEFVHCEYRIGHIQVGGSFMNDSGNQGLSVEKVKKQFVLFHKWYMDNYEAMR